MHERGTRGESLNTSVFCCVSDYILGDTSSELCGDSSLRIHFTHSKFLARILTMRHKFFPQIIDRTRCLSQVNQSRHEWTIPVTNDLFSSRIIDLYSILNCAIFAFWSHGLSSNWALTLKTCLRHTTNDQFSSRIINYILLSMDWFWNSGWLTRKSALCTRIAHLPHWSPTTIFLKGPAKACRHHENLISTENRISKSVYCAIFVVWSVFYGVATTSRLLKITSLFCRISSLL